MGNHFSRRNRPYTHTINFDMNANCEDILTDCKNNLTTYQELLIDYDTNLKNLETCKNKLANVTEKNKNVKRDLNNLLSTLDDKFGSLNDDNIEFITQELNQLINKNFNINQIYPNVKMWSVKGGKRRTRKRNGSI